MSDTNCGLDRHSDNRESSLGTFGPREKRCHSDTLHPAQDRRRARAIRLTAQRQAHLEEVVHEHHDTWRAFSRAFRLVRRAVDEGRAALRGIHTASPAPSSLEEAFSNLLNEAANGGDRRLRIFVQGTPRALNPAIRRQLSLIGREAVMNALRHSGATTIEVEVQHLRDVLHVLVRDNGRGIHPEAIQKESDSHWGLSGMRERAESIGARFGIWSRTSAGTEVRIAVPVDSGNGRSTIAVLAEGEARYDERQSHPDLERRRPPFGPGGCRQHHQQPGRYVAGRDRL